MVRVSRAVVVVPNHLPHLDFLEDWHELREVPIIVMQDSDDDPRIPDGFDVEVLRHDDVKRELGSWAWIIPQRTSACRSFGYYKAWQRKPEFVLTLDNDCYPERADYWVTGHVDNLARKTTLDWVSGSAIDFTRGFPYRIRNQASVVLSHGTWSNVPDLDAATSLHHPDLRLKPDQSRTTIPRWNFFPVCGMNLAWRNILTPAMYFGLFGPEYGFDQYDDIWGGVLAKKVIDHFGYAAVTGAPSVNHRKQSDVYANLRKQAPGLEMNENFWLAVRDIQLHPELVTVKDAYRELIERLPQRIEGEPDGYTAKFKEAASIWAGLFQ